MGSLRTTLSNAHSIRVFLACVATMQCDRHWNISKYTQARGKGSRERLQEPNKLRNGAVDGMFSMHTVDGVAIAKKYVMRLLWSVDVDERKEAVHWVAKRCDVTHSHSKCGKCAKIDKTIWRLEGSNSRLSACKADTLPLS